MEERIKMEKEEAQLRLFKAQPILKEIQFHFLRKNGSPSRRYKKSTSTWNIELLKERSLIKKDQGKRNDVQEI